MSFRQRIIDEKVASESAVSQLESEIKQEIDKAVEFSISSSEPDSSLAYQYVYM
jgi:TPP-dependent pyruvate/acetoin dehydrogenase alpha subunit